jgi:beta-glucanase (GH16 family)
MTLFLLRSLCIGTILTLATYAEGPAGWKLVWQDEFDQPQLDFTEWDLCKRGTSDWDDTMSDDPHLIELKDGLLRLHGLVNEDRKKDASAYLTGGVTSSGKFHFFHGRLEVRARFKCAQGAWPAIWLLPTGLRWPAGGEIDIMEHLNFEDVVYQTIHTPYTIEAKKKAQPDDNVRTTPIDKDDFNVYGIEWDADRILFLVNGKNTFSYKRDTKKGPEQWPFTHPMYVILSMQVGGSWVGDPNPKDYPAYMEIDWVRVYGRE